MDNPLAAMLGEALDSLDWNGTSLPSRRREGLTEELTTPRIGPMDAAVELSYDLEGHVGLSLLSLRSARKDLGVQFW